MRFQLLLQWDDSCVRRTLIQDRYNRMGYAWDYNLGNSEQGTVNSEQGIGNSLPAGLPAEGMVGRGIGKGLSYKQ